MVGGLVCLRSFGLGGGVSGLFVGLCLFWCVLLVFLESAVGWF